jgi:phosphoribosylanthranilate isomerase
MSRIKICGITNIDDATVAVDAGADALGFVFAQSPRQVDLDTAVRIVEQIPPRIARVGVFANQSAADILRITAYTGMHFAQIHGETGVSTGLPRGEIHWRLIRGLRVKSLDDIQNATQDSLVEICDALLLDAHVEGMMGGTGQTFDWDLAVQAQSIGKPIILAGGLTSANVGDAIRRVRPYAVDVSSGVEAFPGKKDHDKIREFIRNAKEAAKSSG